MVRNNDLCIYYNPFPSNEFLFFHSHRCGAVHATGISLPLKEVCVLLLTSNNILVDLYAVGAVLFNGFWCDNLKIELNYD